MAKRFRRGRPKTGERMSLRGISTALAEAGHLNERGEPYRPQSIRYVLDQGARCRPRRRALLAFRAFRHEPPSILSACRRTIP